MPFLFIRGNHTSVSCGDDLAGMKRETGHIAVWSSNLLPRTVPEYLTANCTGRIFNDRKTIFLCTLCNCRHVAWHTHLVDTKDCTCPGTDDLVDEGRIHVIGIWFYIYENRFGSTVSNAVCRCYEGMTNSDDLVAWLHAHS